MPNIVNFFTQTLSSVKKALAGEDESLEANFRQALSDRGYKEVEQPRHYNGTPLIKRPTGTFDLLLTKDRERASFVRVRITGPNRADVVYRNLQTDTFPGLSFEQALLLADSLRDKHNANAKK